VANITVSGLDDLIGDFGELAKLPDSVIDGILGAEADVIVEAQRTEAAKMWTGPYATGRTAASIKKGKIKKSGTDRSISVSPQGKNARGNRNAEVAFINEYGKKGQPARPAIKTANAKKEKEAAEAGEKVYHAYLDGKNL
jgi:HK97 gp10 family phage protein